MGLQGSFRISKALTNVAQQYSNYQYIWNMLPSKMVKHESDQIYVYNNDRRIPGNTLRETCSLENFSRLTLHTEKPRITKLCFRNDPKHDGVSSIAKPRDINARHACPLHRACSCHKSSDDTLQTLHSAVNAVTFLLNSPDPASCSRCILVLWQHP